MLVWKTNLRIIPKALQVKVIIPGNKKKIQEKFDGVSIESVFDENERFSNVLKASKTSFESAKKEQKALVIQEVFANEMKRIEKHLKHIRNQRKDKLKKQ